MKTFAAVLSALLLASISVFAQTGTAVRPRVAPTPTPPKIANNPYKPPTPAGPPVLVGGQKRPGAAPSPTPPAGDDDGIIRVETNLVTMPVSVLDRDGRFISGLQQRDFKIFENGIEQKVDYFQSVEQPFTVVLLIDVSRSTKFQINEIQNAAVSFVNQLRQNDKIAVISFDEEVHVLCPPTNNRNAIRSAIFQLEFGEGTGLYESVDYVIRQELRRIQGRKAVVLFTDGVDTSSERATYESTIADAEESDAPFYTIRYDTLDDMNPGARYSGRRRRGGWGSVAGIILGGGWPQGGYGGGGGRGTSPEDYETGHRYLEALARTSGGREFEARSIYNVDAAFSGIAEELRRQYSLGYYPENVGKPGDRKQIKVRIMRPGVVVRAKNSYIVGQNGR